MRQAGKIKLAGFFIADVYRIDIANNHSGIAGPAQRNHMHGWLWFNTTRIIAAMRMDAALQDNLVSIKILSDRSR